MREAEKSRVAAVKAAEADAAAARDETAAVASTLQTVRVEAAEARSDAEKALAAMLAERDAALERGERPDERPGEIIEMNTRIGASHAMTLMDDLRRMLKTFAKEVTSLS